jgi:hypothetical protein
MRRHCEFFFISGSGMQVIALRMRIFTLRFILLYVSLRVVQTEQEHKVTHDMERVFDSLQSCSEVCPLMHFIASDKVYYVEAIPYA